MKDNFKKHILSPKKRFYFIVCVYFRVTLPVWTDTAWARPRQSGRAPASSTTSSGSWRPTSRSTRTPTRGSWRCCPRRPASTRKFCRSVICDQKILRKRNQSKCGQFFCHPLFSVLQGWKWIEDGAACALMHSVFFLYERWTFLISFSFVSFFN